MNTTTIRRLLFAAALLLWAAPLQAAGKFTKQELAVPGGLLWLTTGDLDGDGKTDIVASYRRGAGPRAQRFIAVFFRQENGYSAQPEIAIAAPKNAGVFDVGDAVGDATEELVFIAPDGVYTQSFPGRKPATPTRILTTPSLVVSAEEDDLVAWDFLRPVNTKEPAVMIIPSRSDLKLFRRDDTGWKPWSKIDIEQFSTYDAEIMTFRRDRRGGSSGRPFSFRATTIVPLLDFIDQNGDGRVDLVTSYEDRIAVYAQSAEGTIDAQPVYQNWFQMRTPVELESRDATVTSQVTDLDGDGVADLCIQKIAGGVTSLVTDTLLFRGVKAGGFEAKAAQTFKDEGFGALVQFVDVDGDGKLEMVHPQTEVSIMRISQVMLSGELTLNVRIRRPAPEKPAFFEKKDAQRLETEFGLDLSVGAQLNGTYPIFGYDFDGDGVRDVILSQGGDKMVLHRGLRGKEDLFEEDGRVALPALGTSTTIAIHPESGRKGRPDVLLYYVDRAAMVGKLIVFVSEK